MTDTPRATTADRLPEGTRLNDIFEVGEFIATGGMGNVYRGRNVQTGDVVAIKVIRQDMAEDAAALALFRKEASILHNLMHDAIVRYYLFSVDVRLQRPYLAMEYVEGQALSDRLQAGALPLADTFVLTERLAAGLAAAHRLGVVHRDISPDNVILQGGLLDKAKIIDFGIARAANLGGATVIGDGFAGKYNYVSPEQLGLYGGDVTPRSDIYSLGLVLLQCLRGTATDMGGTQLAVIEKRREVPNLDGIPKPARAFLAAMLAPDPDERPESMDIVAQWAVKRGRGVRVDAPSAPIAAANLDLSKADAGPPDGTVPPRSAGAAEKAGAKRKRSRRPFAPALLWACGLAGVAVLTAGALYFMSGETPDAATLTQAGLSPPPLLEETAPRVAPASELSGAEAVTAERIPAPLREPADPKTPPAAAIAPPIVEVARENPVALTDDSIDTVPTAEVEREGHDEAVEKVIAALAPDPPASAALPDLAGPDAASSFLAAFDTGACTIVHPLELGAEEATLEAFGTEIGPFAALDGAFQRALGFEAKISVRKIAEEQCPAIEFLKQAEAQGAEWFDLVLESYQLAAEDVLVGRVAGEEREVFLFVVGNDGRLYPVPDTLKAAQRAFRLDVRRADQGPPSPHLLIALAAQPSVMNGLSMDRLRSPDLLDTLGRDIAGADGAVSIGAAYFLFGG